MLRPDVNPDGPAHDTAVHSGDDVQDLKEKEGELENTLTAHTKPRPIRRSFNPKRRSITGLIERNKIRNIFSSLVSWCFEPSQPQRITSGLNTNFTLSLSYLFHKS